MLWKTHVVTCDFITYLKLKDRSYTYFPSIPYSIRNIIIDLNLIKLTIMILIIIIIIFYTIKIFHIILLILITIILLAQKFNTMVKFF